MTLFLSVFFFFSQGIPITSASYYATVTLDQVRHIFRSDTDIPMPLIEERHRILNETGNILLEKFEGSFLNCVRKSEKSAQKLMHLIVESFPSYRDVTQFEVSCFCWGFGILNYLFIVNSFTPSTPFENKNLNFKVICYGQVILTKLVFEDIISLMFSNQFIFFFIVLLKCLKPEKTLDCQHVT